MIFRPLRVRPVICCRTLLISPEVYEARFAAALLLDEMRRPWPDVLDALSRLHEWRPSKADAVYYLGGTQRHASHLEWRPASQLFPYFNHTLGLCQEQRELRAIRLTQNLPRSSLTCR